MSSETDRLVVSRGDDGTIVISGELDAYTATTLDQTLDEVDDNGSPVVLDLAGVTFIDSSALQVLVGHHQRLESGQGRLELRKPSAAVTRLLEVAGLSGHLHLAP